MHSYTVIDCETTGLSPTVGHKILELAMVQVDHRGEIVDEWVSLMNPGRDVGATHIHGISASDVCTAPSFADLAPQVLSRLSGRTIVAHNAPFDVRFLDAELRQVTGQMPADVVPAICTMKWSPWFIDADSRKLADCCLAAGVDLSHAHSALGDARATAELFARYLSLCGEGQRAPWRDIPDRAQRYRWPMPNDARIDVTTQSRDSVRSRPPSAWMSKLTRSQPMAGPSSEMTYSAVLDRVLIDDILSEHEKSELVAVAQESGLSRRKVIRLHHRYLEELAEAAWSDGVLTSAERAEIRNVGEFLGVPSEELQRLLEPAPVPTATYQPQRSASAIGTPMSQWDSPQPRRSTPRNTESVENPLGLHPGDRVVVTGVTGEERQRIIETSVALGLEIGGVTKRTKCVIAEDPNSSSREAAKAREYGIPIIAASAFDELVVAAVTH